MLRLLKIEFLKLKHYRPFWIIVGLFTVFYFALGFSVKSIIDYFVEHGPDEIKYFEKAGIPIFDFIDIWQNLAYVTNFFKWILAFIVIISVCTEFSNKTVRQNVIDGLSRKEFLWSKVLLIGALSIFSALLLFLLGLSLGLVYSQVKTPYYIFYNIQFVFAYALEIFLFLCLAMLFAMLIRRTGFAIIIFIFYTGPFENILYGIMQFEWKIQSWYLPLRAVNNLIRRPIEKYGLVGVQDYVSWFHVGIAFVWIAIILALCYKVISSKNL